MFTIYALEDQRLSGIHTVKYIGLTEDVYTRFSQHLQCNGNNIDKNMWIRDLKADNVMLFMRTLEVIETIEEAREREQHWIHHYLAKGVRLLNLDVAKTFTFEEFQSFFSKCDDAKKVFRPKRISRRKPMTVAEAAAAIGCSDRYIRELRSRGILLPDDSGKGLITAASVKAYMEKKSQRSKVS